MRKKWTFPCIVPSQSASTTSFVFCADAQTVLEIAEIDRAGRNQDGSLTGFQRPQVAGHIAEIRKYLSADDAVLPNSVVLAFTKGVTVLNDSNGIGRVQIDLDEGEKGFVVDGQQRLTALAGADREDFQVVVSGLVCKDEEELRKQFILINNTRPLPKTLIYELLPTVSGLPDRLSKRATAASLVERLNYDEASSLRGQILQHTNPSGVLRDTAIQKVIMNSLSDGVLREITREDPSHSEAFALLSNYFAAVQQVFADAWVGHKPKTSRLVHGAGLMSMGYVMEYICTSTNARTTEEFVADLTKLEGETAWTSGIWAFGENNVRPWNAVQNIPRDWMELAHYLISTLKRIDKAA